VLTVPDALVPILHALVQRHFEVYELEPFNRDAVDRLTDGAMEAWSSSTNLTNWTETTTGGTVNQESTAAHVKAGTYSCRLSRTGSGLLLVQQTSIPVVPGKWYCIRVGCKAEAGITTPHGLKVIVGSNFVASDGTTWAANGASARTTTWSSATTWTERVFWFQADPSAAAGATAALSLYHQDTTATGLSVWYDVVSVSGPYSRRGLYYSSQDVTWMGNAYTGLALKREDVEEQLAFEVPSVGVTFSNVQSTLRSYLEPVDLLTGGRLTCRVLFRDASQVLQPDSLVLFRGVIERPRRVGDAEFEVTAAGLLADVGIDSPRRKTAVHCGWRFGDGIHCVYTQTTLANGAGSNTTSLTVDSGTDLEAGKEIKIGVNGSPVILDSGSGTSWTLRDARTWADNDPVIYTDCTRELGDCVKRQQKHRFGGFPSAAMMGRLVWIERAFAPGTVERGGA